MSDLKNFTFTSESVSEGHPDKICDQISDAILDFYLAQDPVARVAVETLVTSDQVILAGEVRSCFSPDKDAIENIVRHVIRGIGYEQPLFNWKTVTITNLLHQQSADIAQGVDADESKEEGAGDQGLMFGYATNETPSYMPAALHYANLILLQLKKLRLLPDNPGLGPDAKCQVSLRYKDHKPAEITSIVLSTQHAEKLSQPEVEKIVKMCIKNALFCPQNTPKLPQKFPKILQITPKTDLYINPTGRFVMGGPEADTGLTGRKIIVDTYGGYVPHGGGAFSGTDPTKIDRSAAYIARYLTKNIVAAGLADRCTMQLSYAIGMPEPTSIYLNTHGTGKAPEDEIIQLCQQLVDLSTRGIRKHLQLNRPIYRATAAYGHFGREPTDQGHFSWEKLDLVDDFRHILRHD